MVVYEYECGSCGEKFENGSPYMNGDGWAYCPSCGELARKIPSTFTFDMNW